MGLGKDSASATLRAMTSDSDVATRHLRHGLDRQRAGDLAGADTAYRAALAAAPGYPDALHLLGTVALLQGRLDEAIARIEAAIAADPRQPAFHSNLGTAHSRAGRPREAVAAYDRALALDPGFVDALFGRAGAAQAAGDLDRAIADYRKALAAVPGRAEALINLGAALSASGRPDEAVAAYVKAAEAAPADPVPLRAAAAIRHEQCRLDDAIALYVRAAALAPQFGPTLGDLGVALLDRGRAAEAHGFLSAAVVCDPRSAVAHMNFANATRAVGRLDEAVAIYRQALALDATVPEIYDNMATALRDAGRLDEAAASYAAALRLRPGFASALGNYANLELERGEPAAAEALYRRAIAADPRAEAPHRNLLLALLYDPAVTHAQRHDAHLAYARAHAPAKPFPAPAALPAKGRRLRVAYLSSDFRDHPVARTVAPLVAAHDRARFDVRVYADLAVPDAVTQALQAQVETWRDVTGAADADVAAALRADGTDILVCVAGRFDRNRPLVAAWRAAPVNVALGEVATTGIAAYDFIFADRALVPRLGRERFVERPFRLPTWFVHRPLADAPLPGPPPSGAADAGGPVFGCFNNPVKVNDRVLALWAELLKAVPGARLLLKYKNLYAVPSIAARVRAALVAAGVDPARATLRAGIDPLDVHLALYDRVDVALDPFPFSGSTATFEALWMGVPVVTLAGETMAGRWTLSMLAALGQTDWIAADPAAYVARAAALAADGALRARLRGTLRGEVAKSRLCDVAGRTRQVERAYRAMWMSVTGDASCR
jgi:protein O-GlcNAc transferase